MMTKKLYVMRGSCLAVDNMIGIVTHQHSYTQCVLSRILQPPFSEKE